VVGSIEIVIGSGRIVGRNLDTSDKEITSHPFQ